MSFEHLIGIKISQRYGRHLHFTTKLKVDNNLDNNSNASIISCLCGKLVRLDSAAVVVLIYAITIYGIINTVDKDSYVCLPCSSVVFSILLDLWFMRKKKENQKKEEEEVKKENQKKEEEEVKKENQKKEGKKATGGLGETKEIFFSFYPPRPFFLFGGMALH